MDRRLVCFMIIVLLLSTVLACAEAQPTPGSQAPTKSSVQATSQPAWQQEWEKTVALAKQEGVVNITTIGSPDQTAAWRDGFMKAYGIKIEYLTGGTGPDLNARLLAERRAGLYLEDIMIAGVGSYFTQLKPAGVLDPIRPQLILPEVTDPKAWLGGSLPFIDTEGKYILAQCVSPSNDIVVNTDLVKPQDVMANKDLLNPRWKGKMVLFDPSTAGGGQGWAGMAYLVLGPEFIRQFATQEPVITRNGRQQVEWVAQGKYPIIIGIQQNEVAAFLNLGAPIRLVAASDLEYGLATIAPALINQAPHPNAARVFLNWLFTKEGQTIHSKVSLQQSTRLDVPTDFLNPIVVRQPGVTYVISNNEENNTRRVGAATEAAKIILGSSK